MKPGEVENVLKEVRDDAESRFNSLRESFLESHDLENEFDEVMSEVEKDVFGVLDDLGQVIDSLDDLEYEKKEALIGFFCDFLNFTMDNVIAQTPDVKLRSKLRWHFKRALDVLSIEGEENEKSLRLKTLRQAP